ncbi:MAG: glutamate--tRNA ligase [Pirellulales bacterium]
MTVRTRFAPSPTGYLHIGGVRTALFCWLFARKHGGQFVLRIDDTDQQRNVDEALRPILDGLRWLGIDWDEGPDVGGPHEPYHQSQRGERYGQAAEKLLASGHAYRDYATTEEIQAERDEAQQAKRLFRYSRRWMAKLPEDDERFGAEGRQAVVRLKMPTEGKLVIDDLVRGRVEFDWASEQDHVVQRADGSPLYHLASVVDDHDMGITHVVRAEEHLSNTPRQVFIAEALGFPRPQYAHLPYVAEPGSKNKLSKRKLDKYLKNADFAKLMAHGEAIARRLGRAIEADTFNPVIVDFYRDVGYLPEAIVNYLLLLGWSLDDKTEFFDRAAMVENFSLARVNKAPASFDPQKLVAFQQHYMNQLPAESITPLVEPYAAEAGMTAAPPNADEQKKLARIVAAAGDRITVAGDVLDYGYFFTADDALEYDEKAFEKRLRKPDDAADLLRGFADELAATPSFDAASLDALLHAYVERRGINIGQIIHALRVATTGQAVGFGMFDTLAILGRESTCARIERALSLI